MVIFLTCSRYKQKKISNKLVYFFAQCAGSRARGAVAGLDEALADARRPWCWSGRGVQSRSPWPLQSAWPWRLVLA